MQHIIDRLKAKRDALDEVIRELEAQPSPAPPIYIQPCIYPWNPYTPQPWQNTWDSWTSCTSGTEVNTFEVSQ